METLPKFIGTRYVLAVKDLEKSAQYYQTKLGFTTLWAGEGWHFLKREKFIVMLGECADDRSPSKPTIILTLLTSMFKILMHSIRSFFQMKPVSLALLKTNLGGSASFLFARSMAIVLCLVEKSMDRMFVDPEAIGY